MINDRYHSLCIGFIPPKNKSEVIATGDPEISGTMEIYIHFYDDHLTISAGKKSTKLMYGHRRFWSESSSIWKDIATFAEETFRTQKYKLSPRRLARCFLLPQGEAESSVGVLHVADPRDCGEFHNEDGQHSCKYYVKYEFCDNDEYTDENVYVIQ